MPCFTEQEKTDDQNLRKLNKESYQHVINLNMQRLSHTNTTNSKVALLVEVKIGFKLKFKYLGGNSRPKLRPTFGGCPQ